METAGLINFIEQLDDNIDDLEEALAPLLKKALSDTAGKLPLLDKAHFYVLITYAIESILFSYLRLNGVNAKEHPIFRELTRVKQYFEKIKVADSDGVSPSTKLDKAAAGRMIKHVLGGNKELDVHLAPQQSRKSFASSVRYGESANEPKIDAGGHGGSRPEALGDGRDLGKSDTAPSAQSMDRASKIASNGQTKESHKRKSRSDDEEAGSGSNAPEAESKEERKKRKKLRKEQKSLEKAKRRQSEG